MFTFQALLLYKDVPICGGTIIDEKHVVTAAHCCLPQSNLQVKPSELSIAVGNSLFNDRTNVKEVTAIITHEEYSPDEIINDIALLRVI